jgi:hypothetical protein
MNIVHLQDAPLHTVPLPYSGHLSGMQALLRSGFDRRRSVQEPTGPAEHASTHSRDSSAALHSVVARRAEDMSSARDLVRARYTRQGYRMVEDDGIPFPSPAREAFFFPIVSVLRGRIVGTATLGIDSPAGLTVDEVNKETADAIRDEGGHICEIVRLAVEDDVNTKEVLVSIFTCIYRTCTAWLDWSDLLIEVVPRHAPFYRRLFGFTQESGIRICERVGGVESVVLRLRRAELECRLMMGCLSGQEA